MLFTQRMQNELLVILHGRLEVGDSDVLVVTVCHHDCAWPIEIPSVVTTQIRDIRGVVDHRRLETLSTSQHDEIPTVGASTYLQRRNPSR